MRRVVVTGMAGLTALGHSWSEIKNNMLAKKTGTKFIDAWDKIEGLNSKLGVPIQPVDLSTRWPRKKIRTMGQVSKYACYSAEQALLDAGLEHSTIVTDGNTGVAYGSSFGSTQPVNEFADLILGNKIGKINATSYVRMMAHTTAVNIGLLLEITGRIIPSSTACTSGSLAIGYAAEAIRSGKQNVMLAGGAEELCPSMAATFDVLYATSTRNKTPELTPSPYDQNRDGIVVGEGAATLVLEEYEHAINRNATIYAELVGFGTNTDGTHITKPAVETMEIALRLALQDAGIDADAIGFISGHGTATEHGDIAETQATYNIFGANTPMHSLKGYFGHNLGACGAVESWLGIEMLRDAWVAPTANLKIVDPRCAPLDYIMHQGRNIQTDYFMNNNFAFGGINTSIIFKRYHSGS